jgi:succinoglycan biosynthesis transport protein ExoP
MNAADDRYSINSNDSHPRDLLISGIRNIFANKLKLLLLCMVATAAAYYLSGLLPKKYASTVTLSIEGELDGTSQWDNATARIAKFDKSFLYNQYELLTSRDLAENIAANHDRIDCEQPDTAPTQNSVGDSQTARVFEVMRNVLVEPVRNTTLFRITALCHTPEAAKRVAEMYAEEFIRFKLGDYNSEKDRVIDWVESQTVTLQKNLAGSERILQEFKEDASIFSSKSEDAIGNIEVESLVAAYSTEQEKLAQLKAVNKQIQDLGEHYDIDQVASIPRIRDDRIVSELLSKLSDVTTSYAELKERYMDKYPNVRDERTRYNELIRQLRVQVSSVAEGITQELKASQNALTNIEADLERAKTKTITEDRKRAKLDQLEQNVEINRALYLSFLQKAGDITHAKGFVDKKIKITNKAYQSNTPASPDQILWGAFGFATALTLFGGFWFVRGATGGKPKAPSNQSKLNTTILGLLPNIKTNTSELAYDGFVEDGNSVFSEGIRSIRTSLMLMDPERKKVVTLVTSSASNEGRSTVALNLAAAFGKIERTLLIDADVRRPALSRQHGVPEMTFGLADILSGSREFEDCITAGLCEYYDFMSLGRLAIDLGDNDLKNPLMLLSSEKYIALMEKLKRYYDRIIVDVTSVHGINDAKMISKSAIQVVYVVAAPDTEQHIVKQNLRELQFANADVAGVVLNKVDPGELRYYGYTAYEAAYAKLIGHDRAHLEFSRNQ